MRIDFTDIVYLVNEAIYLAFSFKPVTVVCQKLIILVLIIISKAISLSWHRPYGFKFIY